MLRAHAYISRKGNLDQKIGKGLKSELRVDVPDLFKARALAPIVRLFLEGFAL